MHYRGRGLDLYFGADAAFAKPEIYELLAGEDIGHAIRLPANRDNAVRLQLFALAYNLANFLRSLALPN